MSIDNELLSWNLLNDLSRCTFQIELNDEVIEDSTNISLYDISDLTMCRNHEITVTPLHFNGSLGTSLSINFEKGNSQSLIITQFICIFNDIDYQTMTNCHAKKKANFTMCI